MAERAPKAARGAGENRPATVPPPRTSRVQPMRGTYAALDLGTNNCRLLIARPAGNGFVVIDAFSRIVRLAA
jgi:exopolyphosphatase/guanosine-5'-triphosphate,3'-diphosphate pyrophosphatase